MQSVLFLLPVSHVASHFHPVTPRHPPVRLLQDWTYTRLLRELRDGGLHDALVKSDAQMYAVDREGLTHRVQLLPAQVGEVANRFAEKNVDVTFVPPSGAKMLLLSLLQGLPTLIVFFLALAALRSVAGGSSPLLAPKTASGGLDAVDVVDTSFDDVAGMTAAKEELFEVVEYLRDATRFTAVGARAPKGVLLEGPPGTGKTLLARAVAGESNASFIPVTASSFVEMYVGLGAARVRSLFAKAHSVAPCIVWIDEIDAVARQRSTGASSGGGGNEEREATLNELLSAMDGFGKESGVIVLAATNRADILDPALLRPGRFDRRVPVTLPDVDERADILGVHARDKTLDASVCLRRIASQTPGFSGAELSNLMNEAAIRALRRNGNAISSIDVEDAIDRVTMGLPRASVIDAPVRERVAVHEAGHAIVATVIEEYDEVTRVSIVPRSSGAGGFTAVAGNEGRSVEGMYTRDYLMAKLAVLLGGRAAESVVLGAKSVSVGASSDLARAQTLARRMVTEWGMGDSLGSFASADSALGLRTRDAIDRQVEGLIDEAYSRALAILNNRPDQIARLTADLLQLETMQGDLVRRIVG